MINILITKEFLVAELSCLVSWDEPKVALESSTSDWSLFTSIEVAAVHRVTSYGATKMNLLLHIDNVKWRLAFEADTSLSLRDVI